MSPVAGRRATADLTPVRALRALGAASAAFGLCIALPWAVGQACGDRWVWSQWLYWIPAWSVTAVTACAWLAARRWGAPGPVRRAVLPVLLGAAAWSAARGARSDIGWQPFPPAATAPGGLVVTHWNPQWPGERALEVGASLAPALGDVAIVTSPGSLLRSAVRREWLPDGYRAVDLGTVAIVSRLPILEARLVASAAVASRSSAWLAWFRVEAPGAGPAISLLAVDLPSHLFLARGEVASALRGMVARAALPHAPDVVLGDLNSTPGSEVWREIEGLGVRAAPPWRCHGWLCSYRRPWPLVRIDAMFAGPRLSWRSWRTLDLGTGNHRAQQGMLAVGGGG